MQIFILSICIFIFLIIDYVFFYIKWTLTLLISTYPFWGSLKTPSPENRVSSSNNLHIHNAAEKNVWHNVNKSNFLSCPPMSGNVRSQGLKIGYRLMLIHYAWMINGCSLENVQSNKLFTLSIFLYFGIFLIVSRESFNLTRDSNAMN